ncbi:hypothetical protein [Streptomyces sp. YKOK-I1]
MPGQEYESVEGYDGMDPLMAAITGDPLPEEARDDPALLAAHRAAAADVALLRVQLGLLADALTESAEEPARTVVRPLRRPPRRPRRFVLRAVGVAAAGALACGAGWTVVQLGHGVADVQSSSDSGAKAAASGAEDSGNPLGDPGYLACARLVVEGDVTHVVPVSGTDRERVTLRVTRAYKPEKPADSVVRFDLPRTMDPLVSEGDHVLVSLAKGSDTPGVWAVGEQDVASGRRALAQALPQTSGTACE